MEKNSGAESPDKAAALHMLALSYEAQHKYDLVEPLYKQALAIYETIAGPEHPVTQNCSDSYKLFCTVYGVREWKDGTGKYTLTAHFIEKQDGSVRLLMPGGKTKMVALDKLSPADQQHVEQVTAIQAQLSQ